MSDGTPLTKLVVTEFVVTDETVIPPSYRVGDRYSHFIDPDTGVAYQPKVGYTVTGDNLLDMFETFVPNEEAKDE